MFQTEQTDLTRVRGTEIKATELTLKPDWQGSRFSMTNLPEEDRTNLNKVLISFESLILPYPHSVVILASLFAISFKHILILFHPLAERSVWSGHCCWLVVSIVCSCARMCWQCFFVVLTFLELT